jgi:hypothetical protein
VVLFSDIVLSFLVVDSHRAEAGFAPAKPLQ